MPRSSQIIKLAISIRPGFSIRPIDIYFDKYPRQNDFIMQYCQQFSTVAHTQRGIIDHACHVLIM